MSILTVNKSKLATDISFVDTKMIAIFEDERELSVPIEWFSRPRSATLSQQKKNGG